MKIASYVQLYHGLQNYQTVLINVELYNLKNNRLLTNEDNKPETEW